MADKGDDENLRSFENNHKSFLICVCQVDMYVSVIGLHFMREYPNYWELWRIAIVHWIYRVDHVKEGYASL